MLFTTFRRHTTTILLSFVVAGFAFLLVELLLMGHTEGSQRVATAATAAGLLLGLLALVPQRRLRAGVALLFGLLALSGLYGTMVHLEDRGERREEASAALQVVAADTSAGEAGEAAAPSEATTPAEAEEAGEVVGEALASFANNPPILSPLALSGLALLGVLAVLNAEALVALPSVAGPALRNQTAGD